MPEPPAAARVETPAHRTLAAPHPPTPEAFLGGIYRRCPGAVGRAQGAVPPPSIQQAWAQLVGILRTLCRPDGDWPDGVPQTPDHLLPYVGEEAEELLDALRPGLPPRDPDPSTPPLSSTLAPGVMPRDSACTVSHHPSPCRDLLPWVLWAIAASDYDAMGWLEGRPAQMTLGDAIAAPVPQGVRLVPVLRWQGASPSTPAPLALDVVSQTGWESQPLPGEMLVTFAPRGAVGAIAVLPPAVTIEALNHRLWRAIARHQPDLAALHQGWPVDLLLPNQAWRTGSLTLDLAWVAVSPWELQLDLGGEQAPAPEASPPEGPPAPGLDAHLTWPEPTFWQTWLNHSLAHGVGLPEAVVSPNSPDPDPQRCLAALVEVTYAAAIAVPPDLPIQPQGEGVVGTLSTLWPWLRWWVLRANPAVMALMAGLPCRCLCPGQPWQSGILTLQLALRLHSDAGDWSLNLLTGEGSTTAMPSDAPSDAMSSDWVVTGLAVSLDLPDTTTVTSIEHQLHTQLQASCPVLAAWLGGTQVQVQPPVGSPWAAVATLGVGVQFQPH